MAEEIKPMRWQPCAICEGHGCPYCKGDGAFVKFLGRWVPYPIARLDPDWANKLKRAELDARAEAVVAAAILKAKYPADLLPPHPTMISMQAAERFNAMVQALCPHKAVREISIGVVNIPECHIIIRRCLDCAAQLPSDVTVKSKP